VLRRVLSTIVVLTAIMPAAEAAGIDYVTVQAEGSGSTLERAIGSALKGAIAQVNGTQLGASAWASEAVAAIDNQGERSFASARAAGEQIETLTKGTIRQYRILSEIEDGDGWTVNVEATIARYARSEQADRLRVAVIPFRLRNEEQARFRDAFVQDLVDRLTQSQKFAILDRQYGAELDAELGRLSEAGSPIEEMAKLGNKLGADLLIVGTIDEAGVATRSVTIAAVNKTLRRFHSAARLSYRIIDAPTGQIKYSDTWSQSEDGAAMDSLAERAADNISRQILEAVFPMMVESIEGDILFLGQGGKSIRVGQRYKLIRYGKNIVDSYTKENLGREEAEIGIIEVVDVQAKVAKAKIVKAQIDVAKEFIPGSFIARLLAEARPAGQAYSATPPHAVQAKRQRWVDHIKKDVENDW
jgi:TolB-like protein